MINFVYKKKKKKIKKLNTKALEKIVLLDKF